MTDENVVITDAQWESLWELPVTVHTKFTGLTHTHPSVVAKDVASFRSSATIGEASLHMQSALQHWNELGLFRSASFRFEPTVGGTSRDVCLHITVEEGRSKRTLSVTQSENGTAPAVTFGLRNVAGGRYSLEGSYVPPTIGQHSWSMSLISNVPWLGRTASYSVNLRTEQRTMLPVEVDRIQEVKMESRGSDSAWTFGLRRLVSATRDPTAVPRSLLDSLVQHSKVFLRHELRSRRVRTHSDPDAYVRYPLPIGGQEATLSSETCGILGGFPCFQKCEFQGSKYWCPLPWLSLQWSLRLGIVVPLFGTSIPLADRLFLSWRHVRGYKSIGPTTLDLRPGEEPVSRLAATGGNTLWATSLSANMPFFLLPQNGLVATHCFVNVGNLKLVQSWGELTDVRKWWSTAAGSYGCGLVLTRLPLLGEMPFGRLEFNCSVPLSSLSGGGGQTPLDGRLFDRFKFGLVWTSTSDL